MDTKVATSVFLPRSFDYNSLGYLDKYKLAKLPLEEGTVDRDG